MGDKSHIEWTDATWNPVTGCSKVTAGCKYCYAERDFHRPYPGRDFTDVRTHPERLEQPLRWRRPRKIFVNSMSDLFHEDVAFDFIDRVFAVMVMAKQHVFQVLTKRPRQMFDYLGDAVERIKIFELARAWSGDAPSKFDWTAPARSAQPLVRLLTFGAAVLVRYAAANRTR